jgi:hypothetical protein
MFSEIHIQNLAYGHSYASGEQLVSGTPLIAKHKTFVTPHDTPALTLVATVVK